MTTQPGADLAALRQTLWRLQWDYLHLWRAIAHAEADVRIEEALQLLKELRHRD